MVFSNLLFIFCFLPLNLICYSFFRSTKAKNIVMLVFSLIFYAWGEPVYILLLVGMTAVDWLICLGIEKNEGIFKRRRFLIFLAVFIDLLLLAVFKYGAFILDNFKILTHLKFNTPAIALPMGISFYTFQLLTYCIDVYKGKVPAQKNFATLLLYVSMFHQCIAGPIVRYSDVCAALESRKATGTDLFEGITRFSTGLFKKAVVANTCAELVAKFLVTDGGDMAVLGERSVLALWLGVLCFSLQIYFDFSAYSDMAIGMGRMIGIKYCENFNFPYISSSVSEFWRRWHISLGSFFKDYVYIPLGGSRKGMARTVFNLLIVWALTGLWHGASWNFVLWGLYFFLFIALEKLFLGKFLKKVPVISHCYLIIVVFFGWILFKFENLSEVWTVLKGMFGAFGNSFADFETVTVLKNNCFFIAFAVLICTPLLKRLFSMLEAMSLKSGFALSVYTVISVLLPIALTFISSAALIGNSFNPFLYFRF